MTAIITAKIIYLGFLASYTSRVGPIIQMSRVLSLFGLSIDSYIVSYLVLVLVLGIELVLDLSLGFFNYSLYYRILVLLVVLYTKLKLLLSLGRYST